ncbi:ABC transporter permease [Actinomadura fibrosa]|uniref:ABC transporter permease n=1 Tax=Actinomadura fibrosa TaxID=111802 RepID=A0ABW2XEM0_9ACTN|nr:ABC transporter permease [Actinomadura fibrosa]
MNDLWNQITLSWEWLTASAQWHGEEGIPHRLLQHVIYSGISLLCAAVIGLALGLLVGHTGRGGFLAVSVANIARAVPTFGLVLIIVLIDYSITPVLVALVALAVPPILVNTFEGVRAVDPDAKDAARGMGMTGWGVLWRAEVPMALPLILLGLRTSAVQVVATATIAAYPGFGGLGRYIIDGLARNDYQLVVGGTVLVVLLAIIVQTAFAGLRRLLVSPGLLGSARS